MRISPQIGYTNPAPTDARTSRTLSTWPVGAPFSAGSAEIDRWVLAMHTGRWPKPLRSYVSSWRAGGRHVLDPAGAVDLGGHRLDLLRQRRVVGVEEVEVARLARTPRRRPRRARPRPAPPSAKWVHTATRAPIDSATRRITSCSERWSVGKALIATTGVTPCSCTFSICLRRLAAPTSTSSGRSSSNALGQRLARRRCGTCRSAP